MGAGAGRAKAVPRAAVRAPGAGESGNTAMGVPRNSGVPKAESL